MHIKGKMQASEKIEKNTHTQRTQSFSHVMVRRSVLMMLNAVYMFIYYICSKECVKIVKYEYYGISVNLNMSSDSTFTRFSKA